MKASKYIRRHTGPVPDAVLLTLMTYHGCLHHAGAVSTKPGERHTAACLADFVRADLICDTLVEQGVDIQNLESRK